MRGGGVSDTKGITAKPLDFSKIMPSFRGFYKTLSISCQNVEGTAAHTAFIIRRPLFRGCTYVSK